MWLSQVEEVSSKQTPFWRKQGKTSFLFYSYLTQTIGAENPRAIAAERSAASTDCAPVILMTTIADCLNEVHDGLGLGRLGVHAHILEGYGVAAIALIGYSADNRHCDAS